MQSMPFDMPQPEEPVNDFVEMPVSQPAESVQPVDDLMNLAEAAQPVTQPAEEPEVDMMDMMDVAAPAPVEQTDVMAGEEAKNEAADIDNLLGGMAEPEHARGGKPVDPSMVPQPQPQPQPQPADPMQALLGVAQDAAQPAQPADAQPAQPEVEPTSVTMAAEMGNRNYLKNEWRRTMMEWRSRQEQVTKKNEEVAEKRAAVNALHEQIEKAKEELEAKQKEVKKKRTRGLEG